MKPPRTHARGIFSPRFVGSKIPPKPRSAGRRGIKRKVIVEDVSLLGIYVIALILIGVTFFTWTYHNRQFKNAVSSLPDNPSQNDTDFKKVEKVLPLPGRNDWVEYSSTCAELKNYVQVFSPKGWEASEWNHVTDDPEALGECQVIFGFPIRPKTYQESTPGDIAQIRMETVDSPESDSIEAYISSTYSDVKTEKMTINGRDFVKFNLPSGGTFYVTKSGTRFFTIQGLYGQTLFDLDPNGGTVSIFDTVTTKKIDTEFLNRLVFF